MQQILESGITSACSVLIIFQAKAAVLGDLLGAAPARQPPHPALTAKDRVGTNLITRSGSTAPVTIRMEESKSPSRVQSSDNAHSARKTAAHLSACRKLLESSWRESICAKAQMENLGTLRSEMQLKISEHMDSPLLWRKEWKKSQKKTH